MSIEPPKSTFYPDNSYNTQSHYHVSSSTVITPNKVAQPFERQKSFKTATRVVPIQPTQKEEPFNKKRIVSVNKQETTYTQSYTPATWTSKPEDGAPRFITHLFPQMKRFEGQVARFEIRVSGNPEPEITWYKDNLHVNNTPDTRITSNGGLHTLVIPEIFPEDSGLYKVVAKNPLGTVESTTQLIVEGGESIFFLNLALAFTLLYFLNLLLYSLFL